MIKEDSFYIVQSWMITDLKLKGNEKDIYAIIYGFTNSEQKEFNGSLSYLAEWTNSSKQSVIICLKNLIKKNLIEKREITQNGIKFCRYSTKFNGIKKSLMGYSTKFNGGGKKSLPNNIINNIEYNIEDKETKFNKLIDPYASPEIDQVRQIYSELCKNLVPLTKYGYGKKLRLEVAEYLEETNCNWDYFKEVCIKANELKQIATNRIDLKSLIRNHAGIYGDKYKNENIKQGETRSGLDSKILDELLQEGV